MRKVWLIPISIIVLVVLFITLNGSLLLRHSTGNTVAEAIQKSGRNVSTVVYTEEVKGGVVVFYKKSIGNGGESNASGYVKKTLFGWEWAWGGEHSDSASRGFSAQYFPYSKGAPFPLIFGEIKDQQIKYIKVWDKDPTNNREAKIVGAGTNLMWFAFLNKTEGPNFTITGFSSEGTTIYSENINIGSNLISTKVVP